MHGYYYVLILGFCLFSAGMVKLLYVETARHTLEEIATAFGDRAFLDENRDLGAPVAEKQETSIEHCA